MRLLPRSLFGRLALLLMSLMLVSQLFTLGLLRFSHQQIEAQQLAEQEIGRASCRERVYVLV